MKWGLIGYGRIAPKFAKSLVAAQQEIIAVASRSNRDTISQDYPNVLTYSTYEELLQNKDVEIVYISTTHNFHLQNTLDALDAGKHVLCEKPFGLNQQEVIQMISRADTKNLFLMEAMWTRFLPAYIKMKEIITDNIIGDIQIIEANFGFNGYNNFKERLFNKSLAGGSVYDVGIYPIALFLDLFEELPTNIQTSIAKSDTGVDLTCNARLEFGNKKKQANMISSIAMQTSHDACIYGSLGWMRLPHFWKCEKIEIHINNKETQLIDLPYHSTGYYHEIIEVTKCINHNKIQSSIMSHAHSLDIAGVIDQILNS